MSLPPGAMAEGGAELPLRVVELPAMRVAVLRFQGPYSELHSAYDVLLRDWLPKSGEQPAGLPIIDEALNDPRKLPPEAWLTEVILPLRRSSEG